MIVIKLLGGLGNQLFQYALGRSKSEQNSDVLLLDLRDYAVNKERNYELESYPIKAVVCNNDLIQSIYEDNSLLKKVLRINKWKIYSEGKPYFDPRLASLKGNMYLSGYWNSYKYFTDKRKILLKELVPKNSKQINEKVKILSLNKNDSVSIHVRRGDYVSNPVANAKHGLLSEKYYKDAFECLSSKYKKLNYFIFSDDSSWARNHLTFIPNQTIIPTSTAVEELYMQNLCTHHIIANSTFSWWGAWLSDKEGTTICPQLWSNDRRVKLEDLYPPNWIKI